MSQKSWEENWTYEVFSENISHPFPFFYESNVENLTSKDRKEYIAILKDELNI